MARGQKIIQQISSPVDFVLVAYISHEVQLDLSRDFETKHSKSFSSFLQFATGGLGHARKFIIKRCTQNVLHSICQDKGHLVLWKAKIHLIKICLCKTYVKKDHNKREKRRRDSIVLIKSLP